MRLSVITTLLILSSAEYSLAQNAYVRLGEQAYIDGNFKAAVVQLEKGCLIDSSNANALFELGYSYFHSDNYLKSINAFSKKIAITPTDASAYYYRALAKVHLGKESTLPADKEKYLLGAIFDLTEAINIDPNDAKITSFYQNRGIAYQNYAMFKLEHNPHFYDRARAINALKASITDLKMVLDFDGTRSDISSLMDLSKEKLATVVGHH